MSPAGEAILFLMSGGRLPPPATPIDWEVVGPSCRALGLGPFLHGRLGDRAAIGGVAIPGEFRGLLRAQTDANALLQALRQAELVRAHDALQAAAVPFLLLKGMALSLFIVPGPDFRPMSDIDICIRREDRDAGIGALAATGYTPIAGNPVGWLAPSGRVQIEMHSELPNAGPLVPVDRFWQAPRTGRWRDREWRFLEPTCFLHHVALHIGHRKQQGFIAQLAHLIDVDALVRRYSREIDFDWLLSPRTMGAADARLIRIVLALARRVLATPVPEAALPDAPPSEEEAHALTLALHADAAPLVSRINNLLASRSPLEMARGIGAMVAGVFTPEPAHQATGAPQERQVRSVVGRLKRQFQVNRWSDLRPSRLRHTRAALHARDRLFELIDRES